ncbi:hypothetical protein VPNG_03347 [Cytospora leucostoma]|uniref:Zn(2)-C6 fungal-type domain-containing protein n=1 Tax=Cytospora leucostoma TaxID=1230097 RepID=A0A423XFE6_9PEZI|nr:hypothetical protein VPNG_03347 [Cytospora leucostoma]
MSTVLTGSPQQEVDVEVGGEAGGVVATARATSPGPDPRQGPRPSLGLARRRREKAQLSCSTCRQRKTRCDRQQPFSTYVLRGQECTYAPDKRLVPLRPKASPDSVPAMHDRVVQLERLVKYISQTSIMKPEAVAQNQAEANSTCEPNQSQAIESFSSNLGTPVDDQSESGCMRMSGSEIHYVNDEHWAAILDNIADLKDHFDREEQLRLVTGPVGNLGDDSSAQHGALLLYGCRRPSSRQENLASLPPKTAADRYISRYFNRVDLVASLAVHGPTFLREYDQFWLDPSRAPIMWVGLIFGMICLAALASAASESTQGNEPEQQRLQTELYREKIVQCLVMDEYTKAGPHVLETVMHYVYVETGMLLRADSSKDIWYLLALDVNLAKRMGYHRDPQKPLQREVCW